MRVLVVYCHPVETSFHAALHGEVVRRLREAGHEVDDCDLYAEGFDPVLSRAERLGYHEVPSNREPLRAQVERLQWAEALVLCFPTWWYGMPAILKGWFDRVLAYGFAYADGKRYDSGYFRGRRGILCVTTGGTTERFSPGGVYGPISQVLYPVNRCMIEYLGLESLDPFVAYAAPRVDDAGRKDYLRAWDARLRAIVAQEPALERA